MSEVKVKMFEYISHKLIEWYTDENSGSDTNDLSKLKVIKLHFFICAISSKPGNKGLLEYFNNFYAMPFGHVESDIYNEINELETVRLSRDGLTTVGTIQDLGLSPNETQMIDQAILDLKEVNPAIINYKTFDLVDLSHIWESWKTMYSLAQDMHKASMPIPTEMIQEENKIFRLN